MNDKHYIGKKALSLQKYEKTSPISKIILWADDDHFYEAGTEGGTVIEQDCPYATQEMVDNLLATLGGYEYQPIEADGAIVSPIAELGDGITVDGLYTQLAYQNIRFSTGEVMDIAAPTGSETEHEYKIESLSSKQLSRKIAQTNSKIAKTIENIKLSVTNGETSSEISLSLGETLISSETIKMDGLVTFTGLSDGTTTIDGACIKTGTISADRINLTGAITWGDLADDTQTTINNAVSTANGAASSASYAASQVSAWSYGGTTYIDGSKIQTGTVMASTLLGGSVGLLAASGTQVGTLTIEATSTGDGMGIVTNYGGIKIMANGGNVWLQSASGPFLQLGTGDDDSAVCSLGGGPLVVGTDSYGSTLPPSGTDGQVYFLLA